MRLKLIACKVLQRELASLIYCCPNSIDVTMIRQDYHDTPELLRRVLQEEIDRIDANADNHTNDLVDRDIDAILLCYGLCSNAVLSLHSKKYPIIIPRAHDCITLCLGSKERYKDYFDANSGSYYFTRGWFDLRLQLGNESLERKRLEFMEKYEDEDTVEYLMQIEYDLLKHYSKLTYISWDSIPDAGCDRDAASIAAGKGWQFERLRGSDSILRRLLWGDWDDADFQCIRPGQAVSATYDERICTASEMPIPADTP